MKKILLIIICSVFISGLRAQLTYQNLLVEYDSAKEYKNLKIIPIRKKGPGGPSEANLISFSEAIKKGLVKISERGTASTENVHWLRINNNSDRSVFIASGEVVMGGRQDRMVAKDTILVPTGKDQYIPVMCVEEGRWSEKEKKFVYFNYANPRLRRILDQFRNQVPIWREVLKQLDSNKVHAASFAYASSRLDKKFLQQMSEYVKFFKDKWQKYDSSTVGIICLSGNKIIGCDIFENRTLFAYEWEPLLYGYIEEALAFGAATKIKDEKVKEYMDHILTDEFTQEDFLKKNGKIYRYQGRVIHLTGYGQ